MTPVSRDKERCFHLKGLTFVSHEGQRGSDELSSGRADSSGKNYGRARLLQESKGFRDLAVQDGPGRPSIELREKRDRRIPRQDFDEDLGSEFRPAVGIKETGASAGKDPAVELEQSRHSNGTGEPTGRS